MSTRFVTSMSNTDIVQALKKKTTRKKILVNASHCSKYLWYYHMIGSPLLEVLKQNSPIPCVDVLSKHRVSFYLPQQDNVSDSWAEIFSAQLVRPSVFVICIKNMSAQTTAYIVSPTMFQFKTLTSSLIEEITAFTHIFQLTCYYLYILEQQIWIHYLILTSLRMFCVTWIRHCSLPSVSGYFNGFLFAEDF